MQSVQSQEKSPSEVTGRLPTNPNRSASPSGCLSSTRGWNQWDGTSTSNGDSSNSRLGSAPEFSLVSTQEAGNGQEILGYVGMPAFLTEGVNGEADLECVDHWGNVVVDFIEFIDEIMEQPPGNWVKPSYVEPWKLHGPIPPRDVAVSTGVDTGSAADSASVRIRPMVEKSSQSIQCRRGRGDNLRVGIRYAHPGWPNVILREQCSFIESRQGNNARTGRWREASSKFRMDSLRVRGLVRETVKGYTDSDSPQDSPTSRFWTEEARHGYGEGWWQNLGFEQHTDA
jgi:hypothetical protein